MLAEITKNMPTIVIGTVIFVMVCRVIYSMIKNKKKGKSLCGCTCSGCAMSGVCNKEKQL